MLFTARTTGLASAVVGGWSAGQASRRQGRRYGGDQAKVLQRTLWTRSSETLAGRQRTKPQRPACVNHPTEAQVLAMLTVLLIVIANPLLTSGGRVYRRRGRRGV
jgi:hypothetical protein